MAINPNNIRPPVRRTPETYVPTNGERYTVKDGDSWITLAAKAGMTPWTLIRYNYPDLPADIELAKKEVNWYLEQRVGCRRVVDGKNYAFSSGISPGKIWLPRPAPRPPVPTPDEIAKRKVLEVLRHPVIHRMNFMMGTALVISSSDYENVAKAIETGKIHVKADFTMNTNAVYNWVGNTISFNPDTVSPGLIIHECTHALFDVRNQSTTLDHDEGASYIAQELYSLLRFGPGSRYVVPVTGQPDIISWVSWQGIFDEAARIAQLATRNMFISDDELEHLFNFINGADSADHSFYRGRGKEAVQYNGL